MALETLKDEKDINGFKITTSDYFVDNEFIVLNHNENSIYLKLQKGPIKENGINGIQVDEIIEIARVMIEGLNKNIPCRENSIAITKLEEASMWLTKRKQNRTKAGIEGTNKC